MDDLCDAESDAEIKRVLNNLPKDLSETYARLLGRITGSQRQVLAKRMFQWIICARRPLHVEELREGIAFTIDDQFFNREKLPTDMPRLIRGCGNLVVIDEDTQQVHLAHYTVQQYILLQGEISSDSFQTYRFTYDEANNTIGETCMAYLSFSEFERQVSKSINKNMVEMAVLQKAAATGTTANLGLLGNTMRQARALVHKSNASSTVDSLKIDYQRLLLKRRPPPTNLSDLYRLLSYVIDNWLYHTSTFGSISGRTRHLFHALITEKQLPFTFRPWDECEGKGDLEYFCLLGWALENNHVLVLRAIPDSLSDKLAGKALQCLEMTCDAARRDNAASHVTMEYMNTIDAFAQLRIFTGATNVQLTWLYSKLVLACRQGYLEVIRYCFNSFGGYNESRNNVPAFNLGHMLCEAAAHGQLELVEWIIAKHRCNYYPYSSFKNNLLTTEHGTNNYLITEYGTYVCNAMDVALFRGYSRIATLLHQNPISTFEILSDSMEDVLENNAAVDAILEVLLPTITKISDSDQEILHLLHYKALSQAARSGDEIRTRRYIRNFDLERLIQSRGLQPLLYAVVEKNVALLRVLIDAGVDTRDFIANTTVIEANFEFFDEFLLEVTAHAM